MISLLIRFQEHTCTNSARMEMHFIYVLKSIVVVVCKQNLMNSFARCIVFGHVLHANKFFQYASSDIQPNNIFVYMEICLLHGTKIYENQNRNE